MKLGAFLSQLKRKIVGALRLQSLSLKARLGLSIAALMLLVVSFATLAIYKQHRLAMNASEIAAHHYSVLEKSLDLRETLIEIGHAAHDGFNPVGKISRFRTLVDGLRREQFATSEESESLSSVSDHFETYISTLQSPGRKNIEILDTQFEEASAAVGTYVQMNEGLVYRLAQHMRQEQQASIRFAFLLLGVFIVILALGSLAIISTVTRPLSVLADFLDQVHVEDDLPSTVPGLQSEIPEISRVARSFDQLLHRLRGYRTLNVRRLLLEKRRADIIAASIADGIFLLRGEEILYVNPVGERILGLPQGKTWKGLSVSSYSSGETKLRGLKAVFDAISRTMPVEYVVDASENRKNYYLLQSFPITEEVIEKVEHSFPGSVEPLLDRWQANTLVLAQDVSLVKESQAAKSHFIATLSHEVKTPVTSLTMATRLLKKSIDQFENPTHRALIQTCAEDVDRMRKLLEDLLSVSRFDTLTQDLEIQTVDLSKLLKQSVQHFQPEAFERGVEFEVQHLVSGKSVHVAMDATKVSWALSNLITNAMRHTPRGGKVRASVHMNDEFAEVRIQDTGPGIEKNRQDRIFDKFNPFYDLRIARSGSVGMGLAIAREIIVAHGGRIWVTSEPGRGAEFCFTLPLKRREAVPAPAKLTNQIGMNLGSIMKGDNSGTSARS